VEKITSWSESIRRFRNPRAVILGGQLAALVLGCSPLALDPPLYRPSPAPPAVLENREVASRVFESNSDRLWKDQEGKIESQGGEKKFSLRGGLHDWCDGCGGKRRMLRLKMVRVQVGMTQMTLASLAGVSPTLVSLAERGLIDATPEQRAALAKALGVSPTTLFRPVTPPARPSPTPAASRTATGTRVPPSKTLNQVNQRVPA
jgi:transcriptional regulator with XRE-family HTH domain